MRKKTKKIKPKLKLLPSLREKRRYLVLYLENKKSPEKQIQTALLDFLGILGYAEAGPLFVSKRQKGNASWVILSCSSTSVDKVKAALILIPSAVFCVGVSGTLLSAQRFLNRKI